MTWWQNKPFIGAITAYENFSTREQNIVISTMIIALVLVGYLLVIEPVLLTTATLMEEEDKLVNTNKSLLAQIEDTKGKKTQDPNVPLRNELNKVLVESKSIQEKINLLTQALVEPRQMISLLEKVLTQDKQLKLISLSNLPEEAMNVEGRDLIFGRRIVTEASDADELSNSEALIYKHAFEIELEATYDSTLSYLKRLDSLPWQLFWQDLKYQSTQYPKGKLNIKIYTLSLSQEVLGV